MNCDRSYWLVIPGGATDLLIKKAEQQQEFFTAFKALQEEFSAEHLITWGRHAFAGLEFKGDPPAGWRKRAGDKFCIPDHKSKIGRAIKARIKQMPTGINGWKFSWIVGHMEFLGDEVIFPTFDVYGGQTIFTMAATLIEAPEGCTPLKTSEYWQIVEADRERKAAVA